MFGAAIATLIAQLVNTVGIYWVMYGITKFSLFKNLGKIFWSTAVMSIFILICQFIGISAWLIFISAIIIYFAILKLLREPILEELLAVLKNANNR